MTNLQYITKMLDESGYIKVENKDYLEPKDYQLKYHHNCTYEVENRDHEKSPELTDVKNGILLQVGEGFGYRAFSLDMLFDEFGNFLCHGVWE